jgi:hypothetical protein
MSGGFLMKGYIILIALLLSFSSLYAAESFEISLMVDDGNFGGVYEFGDTIINDITKTYEEGLNILAHKDKKFSLTSPVFRIHVYATPSESDIKKIYNIIKHIFSQVNYNNKKNNSQIRCAIF